MLKEFKEFAMRGSVVDLAVGVILGVAFGKIITSLVNDVIMPPIGLALGKVAFGNLFIDLSGQRHATLAEAKAVGAATINYGAFLNTLIEFLIISFVLFLVIRQINRLRAPAPLTTRECPRCASQIPLKATRCPNCTSDF